MSQGKQDHSTYFTDEKTKAQETEMVPDSKSRLLTPSLVSFLFYICAHTHHQTSFTPLCILKYFLKISWH